eukprot:4130679-Amphidinium_carterae.1
MGTTTAAAAVWLEPSSSTPRRYAVSTRQPKVPNAKTRKMHTLIRPAVLNLLLRVRHRALHEVGQAGHVVR